jgi:hypothetical protein
MISMQFAFVSEVRQYQVCGRRRQVVQERQIGGASVLLTAATTFAASGVTADSSGGL